MKLPLVCSIALSLASFAFAQGRRGSNTDIHYHLGPDSLVQEGVPHGQVEGPFGASVIHCCCLALISF